MVDYAITSKTTTTYKSGANSSISNQLRSSPAIIRSTSPAIRSPSPDGVDYASNIKVTSKTGARRDSWDVLNKTKGVLSNNSLDALNSLTEKQLSTTTTATTRGVFPDKETERNTQFNKFSLANLNAGVTSNKYSSSGVSSTTMREESRYVTKQEANNNFSFATSRTSSFKPISGGDKELTGAKAIKVQDIPDGVLGRPVEFESESAFSLKTTSRE